MRSIIFTVLIILLGSVASAQELARIKFTDKAGIEYDALMVKYAPDDVYLRINFTVDGQVRLVHLEYEILPTGTLKSGAEYIVMKQDSSINQAGGVIDSSFVDGDIVPDYLPPNFIWYPNSKITPGDDRPYFSIQKFRFTDMKRVDEYTQINPEDVTNDLLLEFFAEDESEYTELKKMCRVNNEMDRALPPLKIKPTMHFIMVVNKDDQKIGISCSKDQEKLDNELKSVARTLGIPYKPYVIFCANDLTKEKLKTKLNEVNPGSEDIVIFSYSGHGSRWMDQKDIYPFMNLWVTPQFTNEPKDQAELEKVKQIVDQNSISLSEVYNMITAKKARLNVVLGDLCNTSIGVPRPVSTETYNTNSNNRSFMDFIIRDTLKLRKLFIEAKGNLISTAAKPDETASGNNSSGGYYTTAFVDALREAASFRPTQPSWQSIIDKTITNALVYRKKVHPDEVQSGMRFIKVIE